MKRILENSWRNKLAQLPESGMGYQKVKIIFKDGKSINNIYIFNGQECELPDEDINREIKDIQIDNQ